MQAYLVDQLVSYASKELDTEIELGGINLTIFLDVVFEEITVYDQHGEQLLSAGKMIFDLKGVSLRQKLLHVKKISFHQTFINAVRYEEVEDFNYQFLVNHFSSDEPRDSTLEFNWKVICDAFDFKESGFIFDDRQNIIEIPGFNSSTIHIDDFNLHFSDVEYVNDTLSLNLNHFSLAEKGGFILKNSSGKLHLSSVAIHIEDFLIETPKSFISFDAHASYDGYQSFNDFVNDVELNILLNPSQISVSDIAYFITPLRNIDDIITIDGHIAGRLSRLRARELNVNLGSLTVFSGNANLNGLPYIDETFMNLSIREFKTNVNDIRKYYDPITAENPNLELPELLNNIGNIAFTGSFTGFIYDFVSYGSFETDIGNVTSDIAIKSIPGNKKIEYKGQLSGKRLNIGMLLDDEESFGLLTFDTYLSGSGVDIHDINVEVKGNLASLGLLGYEYRNIELLGSLDNRRFNGAFSINDENINLGFNGMIDYQDTIQHYDFSLNLEKINLTNLNIYQRDSLYQSILSSMVNIEFSLENMKNGEGDVFITNALYEEYSADNLIPENSISIDSFVISSENFDDGTRKLSIESDIVSGIMNGKFLFANLPDAFTDFVLNYMPAWQADNEAIASKNTNIKVQPLSNNSEYFSFEFNFKNTSEVLSIFLPGLVIEHGTSVNGNFSAEDNDLQIYGNASNITAFGNVVRNWELNAGKQNGNYEFKFFGERVLLTDSIWIDNFQITGNLFSDTISYRFIWDNKRFKHKTMGNIHGYMAFKRTDNFDLKFYPSYFIVNDSVWRISEDNFVTIDSLDFNVNDFIVYKGDEYVSIDGKISHKANRKLKLTFNRFDINNLNVLIKNHKIDFDGFISGDFVLKNVYEDMSVESKVLIKDFGFNHDHLGDLHIESIWDPERKGLSINSEVIYYGNIGSNKPAVISGYIYPEAEHNNFDLDINIVNLRVSMFGRYLEGFASNLRGLGTGSLRLDGSFASPELSGKVGLMRSNLRVNYLNVPYSFSHELEIGPGHFKFENLALYDSIGNSGILSGIVQHTNFRDFKLDITFNPERMIVLNTRRSLEEMFYGRAFVSGLARIHGPANDIMLNVTATTNRGTQLFLPVDYTGDVKENQFITFVAKDTVATLQPLTEFKASPGLALNFDLEVTPDAEIQIIFDSQIGDIIRGRGAGNISMEINNQGEFAMYGDYTIQEGDYLFTLQNLINKRFRIEQGGTIRWAGDPFDANVDLKALYRIRTSLYDLMMEIDTSDVYRRRIPVDVVLDIKETLFNPSISFDIALPGSDETTREAVERLISTEQEMNRQVFSLLVLNRFLPSTTMQYNTALGIGVGATSSELLSNQLSNWLSQISSEVDIGFNYRPGDEISAQEFEMALSTQLFDDRVIIDGNFGVAGEHQSAGQNRTSNIIGDVNVEVKVTPEGKFRLKAFNRSNASDVINQNAPYTQGVGVFYRKEFDSFDELFRNKSRSKELDNTNSEEEETPPEGILP